MIVYILLKSTISCTKGQNIFQSDALSIVGLIGYHNSLSKHYRLLLVASDAKHEASLEDAVLTLDAKLHAAEFKLVKHTDRRDVFVVVEMDAVRALVEEAEMSMSSIATSR
jgi:hypothetical protein